MNAAQAATTGLRALLTARKVNGRLLVALVLMLVAAPALMVSYHIFDQTATLVLYPGQHFYDRHGVRFDFWFYKNYYYLFMTLAPYMAVTVGCLGAFLLFPENSKRRYFIVPLLVYAISKIMWLLTVESNEDYDGIVPAFFLIVAGLIVFLILFTFDYLMARKFHHFDGLCIRMLTLIKNEAGLDEVTRNRALAEVAEDLKAFNKQF